MRSGDVVVATDPPAMFVSSGRAAPLPAGGHGYDSARDDMAAVLLALGRGAPAGASLGAVRAVDLAPTIAVLLGIDPPLHSEGRAVLPEARTK